MRAEVDSSEIRRRANLLEILRLLRAELGLDGRQALVDLAARVRDRGAVEVGRRGGGCRGRVRNLIGGRLGDVHGIRLDAELRGANLRNLGVQTLAHLHAAVGDEDRAVQVAVHQGAGLVHEERGEGDAKLHGGGGDAPLPVLIRRVERVSRGAPRVDVSLGDSLVPARAKLRGFHLLAEVARLALLVEVDVSNLLRGLAQFSRHPVHPHLGEDHALRTAEAAERGVGRQVRLAAPAVDPHVGDLVRAVAVKNRSVHDGRGQVQGVARVVVQHHVQREDLTLGGVPNLVLTQERVPLTGDGHVDVPVQHQGDRLAHVKRRYRGADVEKRRPRLLPAKSAPQALGLAHDPVARDLQRGRYELLVLLRRLRGRDGDEVVVVPAPHEADHRLEVEVLLAAAPGVSLDDAAGGFAFGHGGVDVAVLDAVVREPGPGVVRVRGDGLVDVENRRKLLVLDPDEPGSFQRDILRIRHHDADGVADAGDVLGREHLLVQHGGSYDVVRHVLRREESVHPRGGERGSRVDVQNFPVGHRGQHQSRVEHTHGFGDVVGVLSLAGDLDLRGLVHRGLPHGAAVPHLRVLSPAGERSVESIGGGEVGFVQPRGGDGVRHQAVSLEPAAAVDVELEHERVGEGPAELTHATWHVWRHREILRQRRQRQF